eukprot:gene1869-2538_t
MGRDAKGLELTAPSSGGFGQTEEAIALALAEDELASLADDNLIKQVGKVSEKAAFLGRMTSQSGRQTVNFFQRVLFKVTCGLLGQPTIRVLPKVRKANLAAYDDSGASMPMYLWYLRSKRHIENAIVVYESLNMMAFIFVEAIPWPSSIPGLVRTSVTLKVKGEGYEAFFWYMVPMYICLLSLMFLNDLVLKIQSEEFEAIFKKFLQSLDSFSEIWEQIQTGDKVLKALAYQTFAAVQRILLEPFYVPIMIMLFDMLACSYPTYEKAHLRVYEETSVQAKLLLAEDGSGFAGAWKTAPTDGSLPKHGYWNGVRQLTIAERIGSLFKCMVMKGTTQFGAQEQQAAQKIQNLFWRYMLRREKRMSDKHNMSVHREVERGLPRPPPRTMPFKPNQKHLHTFSPYTSPGFEPDAVLIPPEYLPPPLRMTTASQISLGLLEDQRYKTSVWQKMKKAVVATVHPTYAGYYKEDMFDSVMMLKVKDNGNCIATFNKASGVTEGLRVCGGLTCVFPGGVSSAPFVSWLRGEYGEDSPASSIFQVIESSHNFTLLEPIVVDWVRIEENVIPYPPPPEPSPPPLAENLLDRDISFIVLMVFFLSYLVLVGGYFVDKAFRDELHRVKERDEMLAEKQDPLKCVHALYTDAEKGAAAEVVPGMFVAELYIVTNKKPFRVSLARFDPVFEALFVIVKTMLCGLGELLANTHKSRALVYPLFFSVLGLLVYNAEAQPCRGRGYIVNNLRTASFATQVMGALFAIIIVETAYDDSLNSKNIQGVFGVAYAVLFAPVFWLAWTLNNKSPLGHELSENGIVDVLQELVTRKNETVKRTGEEYQAMMLASLQWRESLKKKFRLDFRVKLTYAAALRHLLVDDPRLDVVSRGCLLMLQLCASDMHFYENEGGASAMSGLFGRDAPSTCMDLTCLEAQPLLRTEAVLLARHIRCNAAVHTLRLYSSLPIRGLRLDRICHLDFKGAPFMLQDAIVLRACLRPVAANVNLETIRITSDKPLPLGPILRDELTTDPTPATMTRCVEATGIPVVEALDASNQKVGDEDIMIFTEWLRLNTSLTELDISGNAIGHEGLKAIANNLFSNNTLVTLKMQGNPFCGFIVKMTNAHIIAYYDAFAMLAHLLEVNKTLQQLHIGGQPLPVSQFISGDTELINLSKERALMLDVPIMTDLEGVVVAGCLSESLVPSINLSGNEIGERGAQAIAASLRATETRACAVLESLDLSDNVIGSSGLYHIAKVMRHNEYLTHLDISGNNIDHTGSACLAVSLKPGEGEYMSALTKLSISRNPLGPEGLRKMVSSLVEDGSGPVNQTLTSLDVSGCELHMEGLRHIGTLIEKNPVIKELFLRDNHIQQMYESKQMDLTATSMLSPALEKNFGLTLLDLGENQLSTAAVQNFFPGLLNHESLEELCLTGNRIGMSQVIAQELLHRIQGNKVLLRIQLTGNPLDPSVSRLFHQRTTRLMQERKVAEEQALRNDSSMGMNRESTLDSHHSVRKSAALSAPASSPSQ